MRTHTHRLTLQSSVVDVFTFKLFMWRIGISSDLCYYKTKLKHKTVDCLSVGLTFRLDLILIVLIWVYRQDLLLLCPGASITF